jgi:hypothetical protein
LARAGDAETTTKKARLAKSLIREFMVSSQAGFGELPINGVSAETLTPFQKLEQFQFPKWNDLIHLVRTGHF